MEAILLDTPARTQRGTAHRFAKYLLWLSVLPVCGYLAIFVLVRCPQLGFDRWGASKWAPVLDFPYQARGTNADLVIYGDSSAFLGTDPRLIDRALGTHSIVLPNTIGSLQVTGDMALRRYLAQNRPPRVIVLYFTPWDLDIARKSRSQFIFEGEEMLLRNGSLREIAGFAARHPKTFLEFPFQVNSMIGLHDLKLALKTDRRQQTILGQGHMDYTDLLGPIRTACELPSQFLGQADTTYLESLIRRYSSPQTRVLVYLAPIPDCGHADEVVRQRFTGLQASPPAMLPRNWFADDGLYAHILPPHVRTNTEMFVQTLRAAGVGDGHSTTVAALPPAADSGKAPAGARP